MNIFAVSQCQKESARSLCDQHVVKMATETAQILSDALRLLYLEAPYKSFNPKHPSPQWASEKKSNFLWTYFHGIELCEEYSRRYGGKIHAARKQIDSAYESARSDPDFELYRKIFNHTKVSLIYVGPEEYRTDSVTESYRKFYNLDKSSFARWLHSEKPSWYVGA